MTREYTCRVCKTKVSADKAIHLQGKVYVCSEDCKQQWYNKNIIPKKESKQSNSSDTNQKKKIETDKPIDKKPTDSSMKKSQPATTNTDYYQQLTDYIQEMYVELGVHKLNIPWGQIGSQIQFLVKTYNYKYSGMLLTLKYYHEVLHKDIRPEFGIQTPIQMCYDEVKQYYQETQEKNQMAQDFVDDETQIVQSFSRKLDLPFIDLNKF